MRSFLTVYILLTVGLLGVAGGVTLQLTQLPVTLSVAQATPDFIQLQANGPLSTATLSPHQADDFTVDVLGPDLYLRPQSPLPPGQPISLDFQTLTNRFQDTTTDLSLTLPIPEESTFFLTPSGQLAQHSLQSGTTQLLTPPDFIVNQYQVAPTAIYLLGLPQSEASTAAFPPVDPPQSLYRLDRTTQQLDTLLDAKDWLMRGLSLSPDGLLLGLYRQRPASFTPYTLWLYDTTTDTWQPYHDPDFGAGESLIFSPDNAWLLGIDIDTQGYALSPTQPGPALTPIGNFFRTIGISPTGTYVGFQSYTDGDVFTGRAAVTLFTQSGDSQTILEDFSPLLATFDASTDQLFFTHRDPQGITQISRYTLTDSTHTQLTQFTTDHEIISLHPTQHSDALLYGVQTQTLSAPDPTTSTPVSDLLDDYFSPDNQPQFHLHRLDLTSKVTQPIGPGLHLSQ